MAPRKPKAVIVEEPTSTCKHCRHSQFVENHDQALWFCRRYPPTNVYDIGEQAPISYFPQVEADLSCGEFSPKLDS
jgi:hypothetical protein